MHAEVADVFRRYGPSYRNAHKLPLNHLRTKAAVGTFFTYFTFHDV
jgi:hypothetical protein